MEDLLVHERLELTQQDFETESDEHRLMLLSELN